MNAHWHHLLKQLKSVVGESAVRSGPEVQQRYGTSTTGAMRQVEAVALPHSAQQVAQVVRLAREHQVAVYPVSTGKNWGYGCATPVHDHALVVDLSSMKRIIDFDAELGTVTIEPGVTQGDLAEYLDLHAPGFMVPVTGAGPDVSLLGNALERGYGITPHTDHFAAVTRLVAVLPNGDVYRSALEELGGHAVSSVFRWGIGPYVTGLFSQGSLGIVVEATVLLARRPERVEGFFFKVLDDSSLEAAAVAVRSIMRECGAVVGGVNLLDATRLLAMRAPYPSMSRDEALGPEQLKRLCTQWGIPAWTGFGGLYGTHEVVAGARVAVSRALRRVGSGLQFVTARKLKSAALVARWVPGQLGARLRMLVDGATQTLHILEGRPNRVAMPLAYWKTPSAGPTSGQDPQRDQCGLLWHAPLVPMRPEDVRRHVELVRSTTREYHFESPITLTALSAGCFDSTVPLLFDRSDRQQVRRARVCQQLLLERGCAAGFVPYRLGTHQMQWLTLHAPATCALLDQLTRALDPEQLMAPGRYRASPGQRSLELVSPTPRSIAEPA